jgi:uncharacterized coiled-coil DUF342 family protein
MSDTPETDDLARGNHVVPTELAEQLERERDEARGDLDNMQDQRDLAMKVIKRLEQERDEAREKIERQRERIAYLEGATHHACGTPLSKAIKERDEARAQRDSFQALSQSLAETCTKLKTERDEWAKLCGQYKQERDEARAKP